MLDKTQIKARELVIEQINKLIEKNQKKAEKEKAKIKNASVTYQGETYSSDAELQNAYACDAFSCATYDRLLAKLDKARGNIDEYSFTPSEMLVTELQSIKYDYELELSQDKQEKEKKAAHDKRAEELAGEGYSYREIETIIGNEERMRYA